MLGPVPCLEHAFDLLVSEGLPDVAVLDVRLADDMAFELADVLMSENVPFVLVTVYSRRELPEPYGLVPICEKPLNLGQLVGQLTRQAA